MSDNFLFASAPNLAEWTFAAFLAGSEASATYAVENLSDQEPAKKWRSSAMHPRATWVRMTLGAGVTDIIADTFALVGSNLRSGTGHYRWIGSDQSIATAQPDLQVEVPDTIAASTNITGAATDVDEGFTPDANFIVPTTTTSDWDARFTFGNPSSDPLTGSYMAAFCAYVKTNDNSATILPTLQCELYENGVLVSDLGTKYVYDETGQWLTWRWNPASLGTADGSLIECKLSSSPSGSSYVSLGSLVLHYEIASDLQSYSFDSGWQLYTAAIGTALGARLPEELQPNQIIKHREAAVRTTDDALYLLLSDDHTKIDLDLSVEVYDPPDGYLEAGCLSVSTQFQPSVNMASYSMTVSDESTTGSTKGGQDYGSGGAIRRLFRLGVQQLTSADHADVASRLDWRKGIRGAFLFSAFPNDSNLSELHTAWVTISSAGPWACEVLGDDQNNEVLRWSRDYELREKL